MSAGGLVAWLDMAFAAEPAGAFIEVRWRLPDRPGMGQLWQPVERREAAIDSIRSIGAKTDCYVGVAPRAWREGGRDAVQRIHVFWADADSAEAIKALERFDPPPSMVIAPARAATPTGRSGRRSRRRGPRRATGAWRTRSALTHGPSTPPASCARRAPSTTRQASRGRSSSSA